MNKARHILAIDQGTTSTRCMVFDAQARPLSVAQREFPQHYPKSGWVEHDAEDIWRDVLHTAREAVDRAGLDASAIAAIGIANQRETVIVWDRADGKPVYRAIVWQDRRTSEQCARLKADGAEDEVRERTGLLLDPYFSATKLAWILDTVEGAREKAEQGRLAFGTIDSFLLWRLTGGAVHATDITNAARTLLYNIRDQRWDEDLLKLFRIPAALLPEVQDNNHLFGYTDKSLFGLPIPIAGMAGDQQAALIGQGCFAPRSAKCTYGTGGFLLMNTGADCHISANRLLTTPAYRLDGRIHYALEGSIFVAGAAVKWLRDGLSVISTAADTGAMAAGLSDNHGVYMVPAFVGLGAPRWDAEARGVICGLTLDTTAAHLARAALEAVAYQTLDLVSTMASDGAEFPALLRVDGGMANNDWLCQFLADMLQVAVERPANLETTVRGAAFLAGLTTGLWENLPALSKLTAESRLFHPQMEAGHRDRLIDGWQDAQRRTSSIPGSIPG